MNRAYMNRAAEILRKELADAEYKFTMAKQRVVTMEQNCIHIWGETKPDHVVTPGYTIPADPPGVGGVDRRHSDFHVPAETTKRWKRICQQCGKTEHTQNAVKNTVVTETPTFAGD